MPLPHYLGTDYPRLTLYLPHRPNSLATLVNNPGALALIDANSNHWRKIMTLLAKVASPIADDWRHFRDEELFRHTALCFTPQLIDADTWHWIGGKDNLQRFSTLNHSAQPLADSSGVSMDTASRLLLTPYPDYRQLSNAMVSHIRTAMKIQGFYSI